MYVKGISHQSFQSFAAAPILIVVGNTTATVAFLTELAGIYVVHRRVAVHQLLE
jgi:hypothetical protein